MLIKRYIKEAWFTYLSDDVTLFYFILFFYSNTFIVTEPTQQTSGQSPITTYVTILTSSSCGNPPVSSLEKISCPLISTSKLPDRYKAKKKILIWYKTRGNGVCLSGCDTGRGPDSVQMYFSHSFTSSPHEARNVRFWELGPDRVGELLIAGPVASSAATRDKKKETGNTGIQNTNSPQKRSHLLRHCAFSLALAR